MYKGSVGSIVGHNPILLTEHTALTPTHMYTVNSSCFRAHCNSSPIINVREARLVYRGGGGGGGGCD